MQYLFKTWQKAFSTSAFSFSYSFDLIKRDFYNNSRLRTSFPLGLRNTAAIYQVSLAC